MENSKYSKLVLSINIHELAKDMAQFLEGAPEKAGIYNRDTMKVIRDGSDVVYEMVVVKGDKFVGVEFDLTKPITTVLYSDPELKNALFTQEEVDLGSIQNTIPLEMEVSLALAEYFDQVAFEQMPYKKFKFDAIEYWSCFIMELVARKYNTDAESRDSLWKTNTFEQFYPLLQDKNTMIQSEVANYEWIEGHLDTFVNNFIWKNDNLSKFSEVIMGFIKKNPNNIFTTQYIPGIDALLIIDFCEDYRVRLHEMNELKRKSST